MKNKTLMFYINAIHDGGAERVIIQLAHRFSRLGYRCVLVTSFVDTREYPVPEGVIRVSIENQQIEQSRLKRNLSRIRVLRRLIKRERPAALISFMAEANFRAILACALTKTKCIVSVRNDPNVEYAGRLGRIVGKYLLPFADGCVFQTEEAKLWFSQRLQKKSAVMMNQVDELFFDTERAAEPKGIVTTGRLNPQKNQAMLIRAYARIAGLVEDELYIYGAGELQKELLALIGSLGLGGRVHLPGASDNVPGILSGAKLFVLCSDYEGMPNSLLEALAVGLPCISTDCPCGGPAMLIEQGKNGVLIPVGDEKALAARMLWLIREEKIARRMADEAKKRAESFRPDEIFARWQGYVETVIGK